MQFRAAPQTLTERMILAAGLAPVPLLDTLIAQLFARTIMVGTKVGVFEALEGGPLTGLQVADRCGTDPRATGKLLFALASSGYLTENDQKYRLTRLVRKWLLKSSPNSLRDAILHRYLDLELMEHSDEFLYSGRPANLHQRLSTEQWEIYQKGQRSHAVFAAREVARKTPVPRGAQTMLDIGGSHGHYSAMICRRHPTLRSTILDLPEAIEHAAPLLKQEGLADRVVHRVGNALTDDLGEEVNDVVFMANLVHHFDDLTNRELQRRVARSLKPGGVSVIFEIIRSTSPRTAGQVGGLMDFYFALTSEAGTWSFEEMAQWQRSAGLKARKPISLLTAPGYGMAAAAKPAG